MNEWQGQGERERGVTLVSERGCYGNTPSPRERDRVGCYWMVVIYCSVERERGYNLIREGAATVTCTQVWGSGEFKLQSDTSNTNDRYKEGGRVKKHKGMQNTDPFSRSNIGCRI